MLSKYHSQQVIKSNIRRATHKMTHTRLYRIWQNMLDRCKNTNNPGYKNYGGRGIKVCKRWERFEIFYKDMGNCPDELSIERIDNNKGYFPDNCKWATMKEQTNNARSNIVIEYNGQKLNLVEWAEKLNIKYSTLWKRIKTWPIEKALIKKVHSCKPSNIIEYKGLSLTVAQWADNMGLNYGALFMRLKRNWPTERALTKEVRQ